MNKQEAEQKYGQEVIYEAESYYETDFGKEFWSPQLNDEDRLDYIIRAQMQLKKKAQQQRTLDNSGYDKFLIVNENGSTEGGHPTKEKAKEEADFLLGQEDDGTTIAVYQLVCVAKVAHYIAHEEE